MGELVANDHVVTRMELTHGEAVKLFNKMNESYKVEIIEDIEGDDNISAYTQGDFTDLCRGPHVPQTGKIKIL